MTKRKVSSERVSEERLVKIATDKDNFYRPEIKAMAQELLALRSSVKTVRVKSLEWHRSEIIGWNGDWHTVPTAYSIRCADENGWKWSGFGGFGYERSDESAKAAAQADYERRILSAIEATAAASEVTEEMVERGKAARLDVLSGPDEEDPDDRVDRMVRSILTAALKGDRP